VTETDKPDSGSSVRPDSLNGHRVSSIDLDAVNAGKVRYDPVKSAWFFVMLFGAIVGVTQYFSWVNVMVFLCSTAIVLLFGHSLGSHRKLVHDSFQCPKWLEYLLVYCGVQVGLDGPIGLLRQHELRDFAQRLPRCHDYLRHGQSAWRDGWWQLHCKLELDRPPNITIEAKIADDRFYAWLDRTWMAQHLPWVAVFWAWGGWGFVFWGVCSRLTAGMVGHWAIGYLAHNHGEVAREVRGAAVQGRNVRLASLLTMGECWHNNHHAFPGSARLGLAPGEWDPGWWVLHVFRRLGLVWALRLPEDLPHRPELVELPNAVAATSVRDLVRPLMADR
jgi:stearoyl-CoA desaturase (delta-9 desaturase)